MNCNSNDKECEARKLLEDIIYLSHQYKDLHTTSTAEKMGSTTYQQLELERNKYSDLVVQSSSLQYKLLRLKEKEFALSIMLLGSLIFSAVLLFIHVNIPWLSWIITVILGGSIAIALIIITYTINGDRFYIYRIDEEEIDPLAKSFNVTIPFIIFTISLLAISSILAFFVWLGGRKAKKQ
jgi:glucan phosphoethanolaminetransferase (alkaline phosphatase superfamily)